MTSKAHVKRLAVASTVTFLLAALGAAGVFLSQSTESATSDEINVAELRNAALACLKTDEKSAGQPGTAGLVVECMNDLVKDVDRLEEFPQIDAAFAQAAAIDRRVDLSCHNTFHDLANRIAPEQIPSVFTKDTLFIACTSGLVHGLLERLGKSHPSEAVLDEMAHACIRIKDGGERDHCIHGFGHAIWNTHKDLDKALAWCLRELGMEFNMLCTVGVYMEVYYPTLGEPARDLEKDIEMLKKRCDGLSGRENTLCLVGVSSAFLADPMRELSNSGTGLKSEEAMEHLELLKERMRQIAGHAIEKCTTNLRPEQQGVCIAVSWRILLSIDIWVVRVKEAHHEMCEWYTEPHRSECLASWKST